MKRLEVAVNIALLLACTVFVAVGIKYLIRQLHETRSEQKQSLVGADLKTKLSSRSAFALPGMVIAISTHCKFCHNSLPFYKKLTQLAATQGKSILIIFPESTEEDQKFLNDASIITGEKVSQENFLALGIRATPTILALNSKGIVNAEWVGQLPSSKEEEVMHTFESNQ